MIKRPFMVSASVTVLFWQAGFVVAADQIPVQEKALIQQQEHIYGNQLMTQEERIEYRAKMRDAKNDEEQKQIRQKHYNAMRIRAKARGVILPDEPPVRGGGKTTGSVGGPGH